MSAPGGAGAPDIELPPEGMPLARGGRGFRSRVQTDGVSAPDAQSGSGGPSPTPGSTSPARTNSRARGGRSYSGQVTPTPMSAAAASQSSDAGGQMARGGARGGTRAPSAPRSMEEGASPNPAAVQARGQGATRGRRQGQFRNDTGPIEMTPEQARLISSRPRGFRGGGDDDGDGYSQGPGGTVRGFRGGAAGGGGDGYSQGPGGNVRGFRGGAGSGNSNGDSGGEGGYSQGPAGNARGFRSGAIKPRAGLDDAGPRGNRLPPLLPPSSLSKAGSDGMGGLGDGMGRTQFGLPPGADGMVGPNHPFAEQNRAENRRTRCLMLLMVVLGLLINDVLFLVFGGVTLSAIYQVTPLLSGGFSTTHIDVANLKSAQLFSGDSLSMVTGTNANLTLAPGGSGMTQVTSGMEILGDVFASKYSGKGQVTIASGDKSSVLIEPGSGGIDIGGDMRLSEGRSLSTGSLGSASALVISSAADTAIRVNPGTRMIVSGGGLELESGSTLTAPSINAERMAALSSALELASGPAQAISLTPGCSSQRCGTVEVGGNMRLAQHTLSALAVTTSGVNRDGSELQVGKRAGASTDAAFAVESSGDVRASGVRISDSDISAASGGTLTLGGSEASRRRLSEWAEHAALEAAEEGGDGSNRRQLQNFDTSVAIGDMLFQQNTGGPFLVSRVGTETPTETVFTGQAATGFSPAGTLALRGGEGSSNAPGGAISLDGGDGPNPGQVRIGFASQEVALNGAKVTGSLDGAAGQPLRLGASGGGVELGRAGDATTVAGTLAISPSGSLSVQGAATFANGATVRGGATVEGAASAGLDVHATAETGVAELTARGPGGASLSIAASDTATDGWTLKQTVAGGDLQIFRPATALTGTGSASLPARLALEMKEDGRLIASGGTLIVRDNLQVDGQLVLNAGATYANFDGELRLNSLIGKTFIENIQFSPAGDLSRVNDLRLGGSIFMNGTTPTVQVQNSLVVRAGVGNAAGGTVSVEGVVFDEGVGTFPVGLAFSRTLGSITHTGTGAGATLAISSDAGPVTVETVAFDAGVVSSVGGIRMLTSATLTGGVLAPSGLDGSIAASTATLREVRVVDGRIDNTRIGATTPAQGAFSTLTAGALGGPLDAAGQTISNAALSGGTANNIIIGGSGRAAGSFTTLAATTLNAQFLGSTLDAAGQEVLDAALVGGTANSLVLGNEAPAAATFTTAAHTLGATFGASAATIVHDPTDGSAGTLAISSARGAVTVNGARFGANGALSAVSSLSAAALGADLSLGGFTVSGGALSGVSLAAASIGGGSSAELAGLSVTGGATLATLDVVTPGGVSALRAGPDDANGGAPLATVGGALRVDGLATFAGGIVLEGASLSLTDSAGEPLVAFSTTAGAEGEVAQTDVLGILKATTLMVGDSIAAAGDTGELSADLVSARVVAAAEHVETPRIAAPAGEALVVSASGVELALSGALTATNGATLQLDSAGTHAVWLGDAANAALLTRPQASGEATATVVAGQTGSDVGGQPFASDGGDLFVIAGAAGTGSADADGGDVVLMAGTGVGSGSAGAVTLMDSTGSNMLLAATDTGLTLGATLRSVDGALSLDPATSTARLAALAATGALAVSAGSVVDVDAPAGGLRLAAGTALTSAAGAPLRLAPASGMVELGAGADGVTVTLAAAATTTAGAALTLAGQAPLAGAGAIGGSVVLQGADVDGSAASAGGSVTVRGGRGSGSAGAVRLEAGATTLSLSGTSGLATAGDASLGGALTVGAAGAGHATTLHGATAGSHLIFADDVLDVRAAVEVAGSLSVSGGAVSLVAPLGVTGDSSFAGAVSVSGVLTVGADADGYDVTLHGVSAGSFARWRAATNTLEVRGLVALGGDLSSTAGASLGGALAVSGAASVGGPTSLAGALTVGQSGAGGEVMLHGATAGSFVAFANDVLDVAAGMSVSGDTTLAGALEVNGDATIIAPASVLVSAPAITITGALSASGPASVAGATSVGSLSSAGALAVGADGAGADVTFFGAAAGSYASWDANTNTLDVQGAATVSGSLSAGGSASVGAALGIGGELSVAGGASVSGALQADGAASLGSTLAVAGATTLGASGAGASLTAHGASSGSALSWDAAADTLTVAGATVLSGELTAAGDASVSGALEVNGASSFGGAVGVAGALTLGSPSAGAGADLLLHGDSAGSYAEWSAAADTLTVVGATALTGAATVSGSLAVTGPASVTGATALTGTLGVSGAASLGSALTVGAAGDGQTTTLFGSAAGSFVRYAGAANTLTVNSALSMAGALSLSGSAAFTGPLSVTGASDLAGSLAVSGATTVGIDGVGAPFTVHGAAAGSAMAWAPGTNTLDVSGSGAFSDALDVGGDASVSGAATVGGGLAVSAGGASILGGLTVGAAGQNAPVSIIGAAAGTGLTFVDSALSVVAATSITGSTDIVGGLDVTGTSSVTGALDVNGVTSLAGDLTVSGATTVAVTATSTTLTSATTVVGSLAVGADAAGHDLTAHGGAAGSSLAWSAASNALTVTGALNVAGATNIDSGAAAVSIGGASVTLDSAAVSVSGGASVGTTLDVGGMVTLAAGLNGAGGATFGAEAAGADLKAFGASAGSFLHWDASADLLDVQGGMSVSGAAAIGGQLEVSSGLSVGGVAALDGGATASGPITVGAAGAGFDVRLHGAVSGSSWLWDEDQNRMVVTGGSALNGPTTVAGTLGVTGPTSIAGATAITGTLAVSSSSTFNGALTLGTAVAGGGRTLTAYGTTVGSFMRWEGNTLTVTGGIDLGGNDGDLTMSTGNLEVVAGTATFGGALLVNGPSQYNAAITVGAAGAGHDVKMFGQASGSYWEWDRDSNTMTVAASRVTTRGVFKHSGGFSTEAATINGVAYDGGLNVVGESQFVDLRVTGTLFVDAQQGLGARRRLGAEGDEEESEEERLEARRRRTALRRKEDYHLQEDGTWAWQPELRQAEAAAAADGEADGEAAAQRRALQTEGDANLVIDGNVAFSGDLSVAGNFVTDGTMMVGAAADFKSTVAMALDVTMAKSLRISGSLDVWDDVVVGSSPTTGRDVQFYGTTVGSSFRWAADGNRLDVFGTLNLRRGTTNTVNHVIQGDLTMDGKLTTPVGKDVQVGGNLAVTRVANIQSDLNTNGAFFARLGGTFGTPTSGRDVLMYGTTVGSSLRWEWAANRLVVTGAMSVSEPATLSSDVNVGGDLAVGGSLSLGGDVTFLGALTVGAAGAGSDFTAFGDAVGSGIAWRAATNALTVTGAATFVGPAAVTGDLTVSGAFSPVSLSVSGTTALAGATTIRGALTVGQAGAGVPITFHGTNSGSVRYAGNTFSVASPMDVIGAVAITGATAITGTLAVSSSATVSGAATVGGALTVGSAAAATGISAFGSSAGSQLRWVPATNTLAVTGESSVSGAASVGGALSVGNRLTVASGGAAVTGAVTITGGGFTVGVDGAGGALRAFGSSTGSFLAYEADTLTVRGGLDLRGNSILDGTLGVSGALTASGAVTAEADVAVAGALSAGSLDVLGNSLLEGDVSVLGSLTVGAPGGAGADVSIYGADPGSFIQWDSSANALLVSATVTIDGSAAFLAGIDVSGGVAALRAGAAVGAPTAGGGADFVAYGTSGAEYVQWDSSINLLDLAGSLAVSGDASLTGLTAIGGEALLVSAPANFSAPVRAEAAVSVGGELSALAGLSVGGAATLSGAVSVAGALTATGGAALLGALALGGALTDDVTFGGAMALPRNRVHELATTPAASCVFQLTAADARYSLLLLDMAASRAAGCAWATVMMPLCAAADEGITLSLSAIGDAEEAMPVFAHDGDSTRLILTAELPTAEAAAANAARIGPNVFPIYGGDSGVTVVCAPSGKWQKVSGGPPTNGPDALDAERLIIDTGDFDFIGGVNLNAVKDNSTNATDVGDIVIGAAPSFEGTSADGGSLFLAAGAAYVGDGGDVAVHAGAASAGAGGSVLVSAGASAGALAGGRLQMTAGNSLTGEAGDVQLTAGSTGGAVAAGGIALTAGASAGGAGGSIVLTAGASSGGTSGSVELKSADSLVGVKVESAGLTLTGGVQLANAPVGSGDFLLCVTNAGALGRCNTNIASGSCTSCTALSV